MTKWNNFELERVQVKISNHVFEIDKVQNIDAYFDQFLRETPDSKEEKIPYWADLWPSAIALSEYLTRNFEPGTLKRVIELGCGLGLPGLAAHTLGAEVIFTDHLEEPLEFLAHNWALNFPGSPKTQILDWTNPLSVNGYPLSDSLVIASDIAYERSSHPALYRFIKELHNEGIPIILAEPNRELARDFINSLQDIDPDLKRSVNMVELKQIKHSVNIIEIGTI
jgi:predicted nicotinamide N-methyase